jgi:predicted  nucleic acid-binding Zn-ribbon protein
MFKKVNSSASSTFNNARSRMMDEKNAHDKQLQMREMDKVKQEISHRRLEHQKVENEIRRVRQDLLRLKTGHRDTNTLNLIRSTESQLRTLESESRTIDSDIRMKTLEVQRHGGLSF